MGHWADVDDGVVRLPSGRKVRVGEIGAARAAGRQPEFALYLSVRDPRPFDWPADWLRWPYSRSPTDRARLYAALRGALRRCGDVRVELACSGGREPAGTALACLAVVDGAEPAQAVRLIKEQYENWTVATPWRRRFISEFAKLRT